MSDNNYIGSYEITSKIGEGTFGTVFEGYHRILGRPTALKVLKNIGTKEELDRRLDMFIREARILATLNNDNIIQIYDVFFSDMGPCIAMEFIEGENLRDYINMFELSFSEIAELFSQIVKGLEALHSEQIIHRDLKPENLLIKFSDGRLKITDFGIAFSNRTEYLKTNFKHSAGTLLYMSPEQMGVGEIDQRSDLWSLGVILYELLTNKFPFDGQNEYEVYNRITSGNYEKLCKDTYPGWACQIIEGLLQVDCFSRFQSCKHVLKLLPVISSTPKFNKARDLNPEELLKAVIKVLPNKGVEVDREEAIRWAAKELDIQKVGKNIRHEFLKAIRRGINRNIIKQEIEGKISRM